MFIRVPHGPGHGYRCYVAGRRLHHGVTGIGLLALGALLMLHDRRDVHVWFAADRYVHSSLTTSHPSATIHSMSDYRKSTH